MEDAPFERVGVVALVDGDGFLRDDGATVDLALDDAPVVGDGVRDDVNGAPRHSRPGVERVAPRVDSGE